MLFISNFIFPVELHTFDVLRSFLDIAMISFDDIKTYLDRAKTYFYAINYISMLP